MHHYANPMIYPTISPLLIVRIFDLKLLDFPGYTTYKQKLRKRNLQNEKDLPIKLMLDQKRQC